MQEKWTLIEAQSQHCTRAVVGTFKQYHPADTLQHEWTQGDAQAGRCLAEEVGDMRLPPFTPLLPPEGYRPPEPEFEPETTTEELNMVALIRDAFNHVGGTEQFKREAAKNPGELYRTMLKMGVAQVAKETPATLPDLDALSDEDMLSLPTATLKLILLKSVGVTRKSEIGAI